MKVAPSLPGIRYALPMGTITLANGLVAAIDASDVEELSLYKWSARPHKNGCTWHVRRFFHDSSGRTACVLLARQLLGLVPGDGLLADHVDFDGLNNRRRNLRVSTPAESQHHRRSARGSSSRFKGVCWHKGAGKWMASIQIDGRQVYLGLFDNECDAAGAYDAAALSNQGAFAVPNLASSVVS